MLEGLDSGEPISPRMVALVPCSCTLTNYGLEPSHSIEAVFGNEKYRLELVAWPPWRLLPLRGMVTQKIESAVRSSSQLLEMAQHRTSEFNAPQLPDSSHFLGTLDDTLNSTSFGSLVPGQSEFGDTW